MEPFKNLFSPALVKHLATVMTEQGIQFDRAAFVNTILAKLETLDLKARSQLIKQQLLKHLPDPLPVYQVALQNMLQPIEDPDSDQIMSASSTKLAGWVLMPVADFIAEKGQQEIPLAIQLLSQITIRFTSEFAVRYLIEQQPKITLALLEERLGDRNPHVRRWLSEGTRARLPWGIRLKCIEEQPLLTRHILETLKDDPSEYVRRSVANHINDLSKCQPDYVYQLLASWLPDANKNRQRLISHAARTLIKQGDRKILALLGYQTAQLTTPNLMVPESVRVGESMPVHLSVQSNSVLEQPLLLDYLIHYKKKNGQLTGKVFKWKKLILAPMQTLEIKKQHSFKVVTTRVYYPGEHQIEIQINGQSIAQKSFVLLP